MVSGPSAHPSARPPRAPHRRGRTPHGSRRHPRPSLAAFRKYSRAFDHSSAFAKWRASTSRRSARRSRWSSSRARPTRRWRSLRRGAGGRRTPTSCVSACLNVYVSSGNEALLVDQLDGLELTERLLIRLRRPGQPIDHPPEELPADHRGQLENLSRVPRSAAGSAPGSRPGPCQG